MNKTILKHEFRSSKWILLFSILLGLFTSITFNISLNEYYEGLFISGISPNMTVVNDSLRGAIGFAILSFTILSIVQVYMQFRSEKGQEVGRFLKSLPVSNIEFFKVKLLTGILNITLGFIVIFIGLTLVRQANIFWIQDIYNISAHSEMLIKLDGIGQIALYLGLTYLATLSFYTFIFMIQYTFTNIVGGIVTGFLVWLSPFFIINSVVLTISKLSYRNLYNSTSLNRIIDFSTKLLPWTYISDYHFQNIGNPLFPENFGYINTISNLGGKYLITLALVLINIFIAYKFVQNSRIEDEEKIITFKWTRNIFKLGVSICTPLLISVIIIVIMGIDINNILFTGILLAGIGLGYFVSDRITKVGIR